MAKETVKLQSISMKTLGYTAKEIRKMVDGKEGAQFLARIGGIVASHFIGESTHGEFIGFKGVFQSVKPDGSSAAASLIYLPANVANALRAKLEQGEIEIEVFADIYAIETTKNASGYAYICEPVLSDSADKRMQQIAIKLLDAKLPTQLQLAGPVKAAKKA